MSSKGPPSAGDGATSASSPLLQALAALADEAPQEIAQDLQPFRLEGGGGWVVESGAVELFAAEKLADGSGARRHLASLKPGEVFFSCVDEEGSSDLLAVAPRGTRRRRLTEPVLKRLARDPQAVEALSLAVERWIERLVGAVAASNPPQVYLDLLVGQEVRLDGEDLYCRSPQGVVWVRHLAGSTYFLGDPSFELVPQSYLLAVPESAWLEAAGEGEERGATLSCVATLSLLQSGGLWESLSRFHQLYLRLLGEDSRRRENADRKRLELQAELDHASTQGAALQLASTLDPRRGTLVSPSSERLGSELLTACRWVGRELNLRFDSPPELGLGDKRALTLNRLCEVSRLRHRRVILREGWWEKDNGPLLGFLRQDPEDSPTPVALVPWRGGYRLWNPKTGVAQEVDAALDQSLDGAGYMFYPKLPERPTTWRDLLAMGLRGSSRDVWLVLATGAVGGVLALLLPIVTAQIVGNAIPEADRSRLVQMVLALVVAAIAAAAFQITRSLAMLHLSGRVEGWLQGAVWDRLLSLPVSFFRRYAVGDLAARSLGVEAIRGMVTGNVLPAALGAGFSIFSFAILFYYSWRLALLATALVFLLFLVSTLLSVLQLRRQRVVLELQGRLESLVFSLIRGITKLRVAGAEARAFARWADGFSEQRKETIRARHLAIAQAVFSAVYGLGSTLAIFAVVGISMNAQMPVHELLAFNAAFGQFQAAALAMIGTISGLLAVVPTYERLKPILEAVPEVDESKIPAGELRGEVELNQVTFRYHHDGPPILEAVTVQAAPGEFIALVGPSGAGKSTCLRLLLGFERPESGSIYFDGQDLASLEIQSVRRQIGVVLQDARPMTGTIFSNIVGNAQLGLERAWEAARMAGLEEDIKAMPMGMETVVSEGAGTFSGGQKQRLVIARALVQHPRLLFFDEATSALDNRTQDMVARSLAKLKATRIVIAHRLSTVRHADRIYVLDRGRVAEVGSYDELVAAGGLFYRLAERQML